MFTESRLVIFGAAVGAVMAYSQAAQADTWDFADVSDLIGTTFDVTGGGTIVGGEGGWGSIVGGGIGLFDTTGDGNPGGGGGSISVVGTATNSDGDTFPAVDAYFDSDNGGAGAGLGVCSSFLSTQCDPTSDDNAGLIGGNTGTLGSTETLILTFSESVSLDLVVFAAEGHNPFSATGDIYIMGGIYAAFFLVTNIGASLAALGVDTVWSFMFAGDTGLGLVDNTFYINSITASACATPTTPGCGGNAPIPLPAAFPLFATALGGMGLLGWRRRRKLAA